MSTALARRELGLSPSVEKHFWDWLQELDDSLADERAHLLAALTFLRDQFQVTDQATMAIAATLADQARARLRALEEDRKSFTSPLLAAKAMVDGVYRTSTKALTDSIDVAKSKLGIYAREEEDRRRAVMAVSAVQYAQGGTPTAIIPEPPKVQGVTTKSVWKVRVVDADQVPRQYCSPDMAKLQAAIWYADTNNPPQSIIGCEFYQEEKVTIRSPT